MFINSYAVFFFSNDSYYLLLSLFLLGKFRNLCLFSITEKRLHIFSEKNVSASAMAFRPGFYPINNTNSEKLYEMIHIGHLHGSQSQTF